jgi:NPCBM/NEW2 domain
MHPPGRGASSVKYRLGRHATTLEAAVAVNDTGDLFFGAPEFEVFGDGKSLWKSMPIKAKGTPQSFRISVEGVDVLELRVSFSRGLSTGAHAVWIDPAIYRSSDAVPVAGIWKPGQPRTVADLSVRDLCEGGDAFLPQMANSADGKSYYVLESAGRLRRMDWETHEQKAWLKLPAAARSLAVSQRGVLVLVEALQSEAWLLDADTLKRLRWGPLPDVSAVVSNPSLTIALAESREGDDHLGRIRVIDLTSFTVVGLFKNEVLNPGAAGLQSREFRFTPDGKAFVGINNLGRLQRWRLQKVRSKQWLPILEETGPGIVTGKEGVLMVGGKYVSLLHPKGNDGAAPYSTFVYDVSTLGQSAFTITTGKGATALAFDDRTGRVYSNNAAQSLIRYSDKGAKEQDYALDEGSTRQILVHPEGRKLLVLTSKKLYAAELISRKEGE